MSDSKVTFNTLVQDWTIIADQNSSDTMIAEMADFISRCKNEAGLTLNEVIRRKTQIMSIWVAPDWGAARKRNSHWTNKSYWEKRFGMLDRAFGPAVKAVYGVASAPKPKAVPEPVQAVPAPDEVRITTIEEIRELKRRRMAGGNV